jgi:outer membrane protein OmpA-like peptidoglycan-associated protein
LHSNFKKQNKIIMSILNSLKGMVTDQLVSGISSHLGESSEGVTKAMGGIMPTLLGGLLNSKQEDHGMLSGLLSQAGGHTGSGNMVTDLLGGLTGGNSNAGISGIGSSLVSGLLGNKLGGAASLIGNLAGISSNSSSSLMGIAGSLIASFLGKKMLADGGGIGGIMKMLSGQKDEIMAAAPAGIASTLGFSSLMSDASNKVTGAASSAASTVGNIVEEGTNGGGMKWLWPLLLLAALAAGLWYFMGKGCNKAEEPKMEDPAITAPADTIPVTATTTTTTDTPAAATTATVAAATTPVSTKIKLVDGVEINAYKGGVEDKLVAFLGDASAKLAGDADKTKDWYDFDNLNFDLGKSTITKASMVQVNNLAAILKAYPKLTIKVGGYTDKVGDDAKNLTLSQSRADAVFAALKGAGANAAQLIKAEGYGESLATIAETASNEARRADRRTAVRILSK